MLRRGGRAGDMEQPLACFMLKQLSFHVSEVYTKPADLPEAAWRRPIRDVSVLGQEQVTCSTGVCLAVSVCSWRDPCASSGASSCS